MQRLLAVLTICGANTVALHTIILLVGCDSELRENVIGLGQPGFGFAIECIYDAADACIHNLVGVYPSARLNKEYECTFDGTHRVQPLCITKLSASDITPKPFDITHPESSKAGSGTWAIWTGCSNSDSSESEQQMIDRKWMDVEVEIRRVRDCARSSKQIVW